MCTSRTLLVHGSPILLYTCPTSSQSSGPCPLFNTGCQITETAFVVSNVPSIFASYFSQFNFCPYNPPSNLLDDAFDGSAECTGIHSCICDDKTSGNVFSVVNIFSTLKCPWHSLVMLVSNPPKAFLVTAHMGPVPKSQPTHGHSALEGEFNSYRCGQAVSPTLEQDKALFSLLIQMQPMAFKKPLHVFLINCSRK